MFRAFVIAALPGPVARVARAAKRAVLPPAKLTPRQTWLDDVTRHTNILAAHIGPTERECLLCGHVGYFGPFGYPVRPEARCPECESLERHRLVMLWLRGKDPVRGRSVLHFAPERKLGALLRERASSYVSADRDRHEDNSIQDAADVRLDIEKINLPDASYDVIVCSHVLEHVNDRAALAEMFRVLRPGGVCLIMTPVIEGWTTYENSSVATADDRWLHFGQDDHVRFYGSDIRDRIKAAGFDLSEFVASGADVVKYGLVRGERIFIASKHH